MNLLCPKCNHELEIIKACGCQDYFCNHCNELVSKKKAITKAESEQAPETQPDAKAS